LIEKGQVHFQGQQCCIARKAKGVKVGYYRNRNKLNVPNNYRRKLKSVIHYLKEILSGNIDFTTRTLTFSSTDSMSLTEVTSALEIFETCSNPLKVVK